MRGTGTHIIHFQGPAPQGSAPQSDYGYASLFWTRLLYLHFGPTDFDETSNQRASRVASRCHGPGEEFVTPLQSS